MRERIEGGGGGEEIEGAGTEGMGEGKSGGDGGRGVEGNGGVERIGWVGGRGGEGGLRGDGRGGRRRGNVV